MAPGAPASRRASPSVAALEPESAPPWSSVGRPCRLADHGGHRLDAATGQVHRQVAPVCPEVGERRRGAALLRVQPPVAHAPIRQPVLQVHAVNMEHLADQRPPGSARALPLPSRSGGSCGTARSDRRAVGGSGHERARVRDVAASGFSAIRCLPRRGTARRPRHGGGWGCSCHDVDRRVLDERTPIAVCLGHRVATGRPSGRPRRRGGDRRDLGQPVLPIASMCGPPARPTPITPALSGRVMRRI